MFFVALAMLVEASQNMYFATQYVFNVRLLYICRYFLSSALYVFGALIGSLGCWTFVGCSYPEAIVSSCFYANSSIVPPEGSWCFRIHFGTRVLRAAHLQLWGAILYASSCAMWIQEDYQYSIVVKHHSGIDSTGEYMVVVCSCFLLVSACYFQLLAQYPQSLRGRATSMDSTTGLSRSEFLSVHFGTYIQLCGWFFAVLSTMWLLRSAIQFDEGEEDAPWDWSALFHSFTAFAFAMGSYFMLAQAYGEGTRTDAYLIAHAKEVRAEEGRSKVPHPLSGITDMTDSKNILRAARVLLNGNEWDETSTREHTRVWTHRRAHAVKFETDLFSKVSPLIVAATLQSEIFKKTQDLSVSVIGKLTLKDGASTNMYFEKFPANPPMPAHESMFASLLHESRKESEFAELVEWAVSGPLAQKGLLRVNPFRFYSVSSEGVLSGTVWLEEISEWMPDFLLKAEMKKVPEIINQLENFFSKNNNIDSISNSVNHWIWQKLHNSISPLAAAVLVRTAPSYRVLLAKQAGLRTKIPLTVSVPSGPMDHPLSHFPMPMAAVRQLPAGELPVLIKHAADFASTEFGKWEPEEHKVSAGKPKLSVWRMDLDDESVRPFRIQTRVYGVDPLTLATIIHRNRLDCLVNTAPKGSSDRRGSSPFQSNISGVSNMSEEDGGVTVGSVLKETCLDGAIKVFTDRRRRTKYMPTSRDREFTFASIMKDVSPLKAVVVHWGVSDETTVPNMTKSPTSKSLSVQKSGIPKSASTGSILCLRKFQVWTLENDGGTDTKVTWCGLVPVGGRMEKVSALVSSHSELKSKFKYMEKLANLFTTDMLAKDSVAETHAFIGYSTLRNAMGRELKKLSMNYLANTSEDYKALLGEIQPVTSSNVMGFAEELQQLRKSKRREEEVDSCYSSNITIPFSPVPSHLRLAIDDDDDAQTQKNDDLDEQEDMIPSVIDEDDHEVANERIAR